VLSISIAAERARSECDPDAECLFMIGVISESIAMKIQEFNATGFHEL